MIDFLLRWFRKTKDPAPLMPVVLGYDEHGGDIIADLAEAAHWAIQGRTRSGKTSTLYGVLYQAVKQGAVIGGIDPDGILFDPLEAYPRPDLRASGATPAENLEAMQSLVAEMEQRIEWLRRSHLDKIPLTQFPLVMAVFDEFPKTLASAEADDKATGRKPAERIQPQIFHALSRLIFESAKVGFRVVLVSQRADASVIGGAVRANIGTFICFGIDRQGVAMFWPYLDSEAQDQPANYRPGEALVSLPTSPEPVHAQMDYLAYGEYCRRILRHAIRDAGKTVENGRNWEKEKTPPATDRNSPGDMKSVRVTWLNDNRTEDT